MNIYLIVVAGGAGIRMKTSTPKQFLQINNKPVIVHTIERFTIFINSLKIIVVINSDYKGLWENIVEKYNLDIYKTVTGGKERFFSVRNGLAAIVQYDGEDIVLIHDAVRPLVNKNVIVNVIKTTNKEGSAIPVYKISDSVRKIIKNKESKLIDRSNVYLVQTPQGFNLSKLKKAYNQKYLPYFTDDASVYENAGFTLHFVEGNRENIKITYPEDIIMAKCILKSMEV